MDNKMPKCAKTWFRNPKKNNFKLAVNYAPIHEKKLTKALSMFYGKHAISSMSDYNYLIVSLKFCCIESFVKTKIYIKNNLKKCVSM